MSMPLPERDFAWFTREQLETFNVMDIPNDSEIGYTLQVDLEYPDDHLDYHNDYSLTPENKIITDEMLFPHTIMLKENKHWKEISLSLFQISMQRKSRGLSRGLKLAKIHRVLEFTQSPWLKSYINFNSKAIAS